MNLAAATATASAAGRQTSQYLSFFVGDEEFGLGILEAREISQYPEVTKVPAMPPAIRGVINLRGSVVPLLDLAIRLGMPERPVSRWTCVVVVESPAAGSERIGIIVDRVSQVIELPDEEVESPPEFGTAVHRRFLRGMGKAGQKFVLILDLATLLADLDVSEMMSDGESDREPDAREDCALGDESDTHRADGEAAT